MNVSNSIQKINSQLIHDLVQFSHSVVSDSLWPHESQHARPPCPSPTPGVYLNSCPLSWWCHPTISSSVFPFSSCLQSFPASGSFQMSQLFTSDGQSIGVSPSTSVLSMNTQDWFSLGWTGCISLQSKGLKNLLQHHNSKASILLRSAFFTVQLSHPYMTTGKTIALTRRTFVDKVMSLLFNMLSRLVINTSLNHKLSEENIRINFHDLGFRDGFLDMIPKAWATEEKQKNWILSKFKPSMYQRTLSGSKKTTRRR